MYPTFQGGGYLEVAIHEFHIGVDVPIQKLYPDKSESWIETIIQIGRRRGPFRVSCFIFLRKLPQDLT